VERYRAYQAPCFFRQRTVLDTVWVRVGAHYSRVYGARNGECSVWRRERRNWTIEPAGLSECVWGLEGVGEREGGLVVRPTYIVAFLSMFLAMVMS
jgi:hypothetical protein